MGLWRNFFVNFHYIGEIYLRVSFRSSRLAFKTPHQYFTKRINGIANYDYSRGDAASLETLYSSIQETRLFVPSHGNWQGGKSEGPNRLLDVADRPLRPAPLLSLAH